VFLVIQTYFENDIDQTGFFSVFQIFSLSSGYLGLFFNNKNKNKNKSALPT